MPSINEQTWNELVSVQKRLVALHRLLRPQYAVSWGVLPDHGVMMANLFLVDSRFRPERILEIVKVQLDTSAGSWVADVNEKITEWENKYGLLTEQH